MTLRALVVDDDQGVRYMLRSALEDAVLGVGVEVEEAVDGQAALSTLLGFSWHTFARFWISACHTQPLDKPLMSVPSFRH